jgi:hypothetical protein
MQLTLRQQIMQFAHTLQSFLFPTLEQALGPLDDKLQRLVAVLEMIPLARYVPCARGWVGRPSKDRLAIASAFVAKAVYGFSLTRQLLDRLHQDDALRKLCGWEYAHQIPSESTFSRAFAEFAESELAQWVHGQLVEQTQKDRLIGHISRDSTAIEARERYAQKPAKQTPPAAAKPKGKRGPKPGKRGPHKRYKGGQRCYQPNSQSRLHRQRSMPLEKMLQDLPCQCSLGVKTSNDGNQKYWRGYKLHVDVADGQIPITAVLTSASLHDSQAAIPLATLTAERVSNLYDVMDTAYDATEILDHSRSLGHVPIVRPAKRGRQDVPPEERAGRTFSWAEEDRFRERTAVERVFARLKDEFGAREIRVRGAKKVMQHLMFGVLALTADQILKLVS